MEGVSPGACSLAGPLGLGKLICLYDSNGISIDGEIAPWFGEDTALRYEAYGWQVIRDVDGHDHAALDAAISAAKAETGKPTLIICRTKIGYGSPNLQGTEKTHGAPLGKEEIALTKQALGLPAGDFELPPDAYQIASLREKDGQDEAELILNAWQPHADTLLVLIPRHPERFQAAYELARQRGFNTQKRSDNAPVRPDTQVWIGDSMGEMYAYFQAADIVFIGGSLVDTGCQNIIEPLQCGKPVLFGPSIYNFQAACQEALATGVAQQIHSAAELVQTVTRQLAQPEIYAQQTAKTAAYLAQHRGASQRIADAIEQHVQANASNAA